MVFVRSTLLLALVALVVVAGCSRKKNGFTNRLYHGTTTHFNYHFNAREIIRLTELDLWENRQDDYDELLTIFNYPDKDKAKSLESEMDRAIEKCSIAIDRHSMDIRKKEYNKWIAECYFVIGQANFYKGNFSEAEEVFSFVGKKYKNLPIRYLGAAWLAKTYVETERYAKANSILSILENAKEEDFPKGLKAEIAMIKADMTIKQERWEDVTPALQDAIALTEDKDLQTRLTFILAQVYEKLNKSDRAITTYASVLKMRPDYEMEFYAKIRQALAYNRRLDSGEIKKMLNKVLNDKKYEDYYDQVYYALAEIELQDRNDPEGIALLEKSTEISKNPKQKVKSFRRLADLYFENRNYRLSKNYYDSTVTFMKDDHPDYYEMSSKAESLDELVTDLITIELEDSLLALSSMSEKDREKKILRMIADMEEEEERKRQKALAALENPTLTPTSGGPTFNFSDEWYFYNSSTVSEGIADFKRQWGNRKLEDNWRRSNKAKSFDYDDDGDAVLVANDSVSDPASGGSGNIKTLEEYLADVPLTDEAVSASVGRLVEALYNSGLTYKEKLFDVDNAIEAFSRILDDFDTTSVALTATYQLYRIYYDREQEGQFLGTGFRDNSAYYKDIILERYPDSEFARIINDPDYAKQLSRAEEEDRIEYETVYTKFTRRQYNDVLIACNTIITEKPGNNYLPKYYLMKAMTISARGDAESYEKALRETVSLYPDTEEGELARELLGYINNAKAKSGDDADSQQGNSTTADSPFILERGTEHFFTLVVPKEGVNVNDLKNEISDFNAEFFNSKNLRITNSFIDKEHQILIIRTFPDDARSMEYLKKFIADEDLLKKFDPSNVKAFVISTKNFTQLFRTKDVDGYYNFFTENYK